jgi:hypothetical protein
MMSGLGGLCSCGYLPGIVRLVSEQLLMAMVMGWHPCSFSATTWARYVTSARTRSEQLCVHGTWKVVVASTTCQSCSSG